MYKIIPICENIIDFGTKTSKENIYFDANEKSPIICYKFDKKVVGHFSIEIGNNSGDELLIEYGPYPDCMFFKYRINLLGKKGLFISEETFAMQYFRLSLVDKSICPEETFLSFSNVSIIDSSYQFEKVGKFCSDNKLFNKIWEVGSYTLQLCTQEQKYSCNYDFMLPKEKIEKRNNFQSEYGNFLIFDGARRDKEAWIGDLRTEALIAYAAFADARPIKATLDLFMQLQDEKGLVPGSGTSCQPFLTYNLWWVIAIWENYLYTKDIKFLKNVYHGVEKFEKYLLNNLDERGFLPNENYDNTWMWTFPRGKIVASVQAELYFALECIVKIENEIQGKNAQQFLDLSKKLKENFNKEFYNEEKGVFEEKVNLNFAKQPVFLDVNVYAVAFSLCDEDKALKILKYIKENHHTNFGTTTTDFEIEEATLTDDRNGMMIPFLEKNGILNTIRPHNHKIWPFMVGYEVEANFKHKKTQDAFDIIAKTWGNMINQGATTFWEMYDNKGKFCNYSFIPQAKHDCIDSACHGWSGWVTHLLTKYVAGISPLKAGFESFLFSPQIGELNNLESVINTPYGNIEIAIKQNVENIYIDIIYPKQCRMQTYFEHIKKKIILKEKQQ